MIGLPRIPQLKGDHVKVRFARDIRMDDLKQSNAVLIGPRANPWVELLEPESNFKMEFPAHLDGRHLDERLILNKHPRAGELTRCTNMTADGTHRTYTVVSFLPSLSGTGHTLLLQGQNMAGTQAAGDFVMDEAAMMPTLNKARQPTAALAPSRCYSRRGPEVNRRRKEEAQIGLSTVFRRFPDLRLSV